MKDFARLFNLLTVLERDFGLSSLNSGERQVLNFITERMITNKPPTMVEIVDQGFTSRASTYRRVAALCDAGIIQENNSGPLSTYEVSPRFADFTKQFAKRAKKIGVF